MSTSPARRRRLAMARTFRQATCATCGADLSRVDFPAIHLQRCERLAAERASAAKAVEIAIPRPARASMWDALRRLAGMATRGAAE